MDIVQSHPRVQPGEPAPDFTLPAADREGTVSLADYRGKSSLLLALFRGLYCPLCRRNIAQTGLMAEQLQAAGVEMLGVVATKPEHARSTSGFTLPASRWLLTRKCSPSGPTVCRSLR
jgi:peroxiredoxin